jgi:hypothetical protein
VFFLGKHKFTELKTIFLFLYNAGKSKKISGTISQIPKIPGKIFPEKFSENGDVFYVKIQCYRAKITLFIIMKVRTLGGNFEENFREISQIPKIPGRNFSGKFPGNSGYFFRGKSIIQSVNLSFYVCKR